MSKLKPVSTANSQVLSAISCRLDDRVANGKVMVQAAPAHREVLAPLPLLLSLSWRTPSRSTEGPGLVFRIGCEHA